MKASYLDSLQKQHKLGRIGGEKGWRGGEERWKGGEEGWKGGGECF